MKTFLAFAGVPLGVFVALPIALGSGLGAVFGTLEDMLPIIAFAAGIGLAAALAAALIAWVAFVALRFIFARLHDTPMPRGSKIILSILATIIVLLPLWPFVLLMVVAFTGASFS